MTDKHQLQAAINAATAEAKMYGASAEQIRDMVQIIKSKYTEMKNAENSEFNNIPD